MKQLKALLGLGVDPLSWTVFDLPVMRLCSAALLSKLTGDIRPSDE
jgi:hypothetical protein